MFGPDTCVLRKYPIHRLLERNYTLTRIDPPKNLTNRRFVWLDETQKTVWVLVISATNPKSKALVGYRNNPTPVFCKWLLRLEAFLLKSIEEKISQSFAPNAGIDELIFLSESGKPVGAKLDVG